MSRWSRYWNNRDKYKYAFPKGRYPAYRGGGYRRKNRRTFLFRGGTSRPMYVRKGYRNYGKYLRPRTMLNNYDYAAPDNKLQHMNWVGYPLFPEMSQSLSYANRTTDKIQIKSIFVKMDLWLTGYSGETDWIQNKIGANRWGNTRIIIFTCNIPVNGVQPLPTDLFTKQDTSTPVFATSDINSMRRLVNVNDYTIHYDKMHMLFAEGKGAKNIRIKLKKPITIQWARGTADYTMGNVRRGATYIYMYHEDNGQNTVDNPLNFLGYSYLLRTRWVSYESGSN